MKRVFFFTVLVLLVPFVVLAQLATPSDNFNNNGTRPAQFLKLAVGARAAAMGGTFAAVANDGSALFWNPAGISNLKSKVAHLTHVDYLLDIKFDFAGLVVPIKKNTHLGFSAVALTMGEEPQTSEVDPDGELGVTWSASSFAIGMTYTRTISDRFSVGVTGKYIQENLFNISAKTLAVDIGSLYDTGYRGMKIGMAMSNFGGKMKIAGRDLTQRNLDPFPIGGNFDEQAGDLQVNSWPLPLNFRIGLSFELMRRENNVMLLAADFNHPTDADEQLNFGAEYSMNKRLFLRGGYKFNYEEESFTAGGGIKLPLSS
jgi:long-subunit fatty acid transport protein